MSKSLQFMDCAYCGKRVATTARSCHHCQQRLVSNQTGGGESPADDEGDSHLAAAGGGYDSDDDDFDYDEFVEREFGAKRHRTSAKPWIRATAWLAIGLILLSTLIYAANILWLLVLKPFADRQ